MSEGTSSPSPSPSPSPSRTLRSVRTRAIRRNTVDELSSGRPSPYGQWARVRSASDTSGAGIGGPPKRRESLSGLGGNLRSTRPLGLGRAMGRASSNGPPSSDLSDMLRRTSTLGPGTSSPGGGGGLSLSTPPPVRRRGSADSPSPPTADASSPAAGPTVFPTNPRFSYGRQKSTWPAPKSPGLESIPLTHACTVPAESLGLPPSQSQAGSPCPPTSVATVGLPESGEIVDVVGPSSRPSVVYAPVRRASEIGGRAEGKHAMQGKTGIGGKLGKGWMAGRPSGIGMSAPRDQHPESGLRKLFRAFRGSKRRRPGSPD